MAWQCSLLTGKSDRQLPVAGRPVLMAGTCFKALRNSVSDMAANALTPARSNSLFLAPCINWAARCFRSSSTVYSAFGIVKLSRTSLCFLVFFSSLTTGVATGGVSTFAVTGSTEGDFFTTTFLATVALSITALEGTVLGAIFLDAMTAVGLALMDGLAGFATTGLGVLALMAGWRAAAGFAALMGAIVLAWVVARTWVGVAMVGIKTFKEGCGEQAQTQVRRHTFHNNNDK